MCANCDHVNQVICLFASRCLCLCHNHRATMIGHQQHNFVPSKTFIPSDKWSRWTTSDLLSWPVQLFQLVPLKSFSHLWHTSHRRYHRNSHSSSSSVIHSVFNIIIILLLLIGFSQCARQALRYNYPRDEVNFSYSQEEYNQPSEEDESRLPEFVGQVPNVTVQIGREARLPCVIKNLATYRAAWIRDEEKNILTLQRQMVTRDPRISLQEESQIDIGGEDFQEHNRIRYFVLIIRNVEFGDRGGYMCQINTQVMKSQIGYLRVVVPPDIIDQESSSDITVREGENISMKCKAKGFPQPDIEWRREDGNRVPLGGSRRQMLNKTEGELLEITRVTRVHSGAWLCIASNGVMPSVSRRILLNVQFAPQIWIPIEEIGAPLGSNITLDCHIEAYPLPLNYWTFGSQTESIYISGPKYEVSVKEKGYKRHLKLTIHKLEKSDLGQYHCIAQNALGKQEKLVRVYASDTHQQTHSKQSISSMTTTGGKKKNRPKLKRKKVVPGGGLNQTVMNESGQPETDAKVKPGSGSSLEYSVINTFSKPKADDKGTGAMGKKLANDQQQRYRSETQNEEGDFEMDDDDYAGSDQDDYAHYGTNAASSLPRHWLPLVAFSVSLIVCALSLGH